MEIEYFVKPDEAPELHKEWVENCQKFLLETI
jgi:hypothetical protein